MAIVAAMKKPSSKSTINVRTAPDIVSMVKLAVVRMAALNHEFRGRKLGVEGFVGAVLLEILDRTDDELDAILKRRLPEVEKLFREGGMEDEEVGETRPREGGGFDLPKGGREDILPVEDVFPHVKKRGNRKPKGA